MSASVEEELEAIRETSGMLTDCYPSGYLEELHQEWPE
jgi:hypothetical protein